ncbi:YtxH domain-containing protein [Lentibacillus cibarius]|uniref:YtxH domain-containing protein n=1 Tax=Lentibacillus cibarius TaxID=2583219 RepID=A0A5S3QHA9_9BACI|nr:YtxH domain-containing protein [Lentibacillus cibarius]TMN21197.1 YtxH domain-containing protein [Lentibacillus cibarius]
MENCENQKFNGKEFVIGSVIGATGGALTALLLAPKSGNELRGDLNTGAAELKSRAGEWKNTAYDKGSEWKNKAAETTSRFTQKAQELTRINAG